MLGVWNDAASNQEGDLSDARIYRHIRLEAGSYYFGAAFNACYQVSPHAYMFVSTELYGTHEIPGNALAYYALAEATNNMQWHGLNFTLAEDTDLYIGFQMDLTSGSTTQEIRAEKVKLAYYGATAIEDVEYTEQPVDTSIYTLQGVKVNTSIDMLPRGLYIIGNKKMIVR